MAYDDLNNTQDPTTGERILANWGDRVRDNQEDHESRINTAQTDADAAAQAVTDHENADPAHAASAISIADAGGYYTGTEVEAALQEGGAKLETTAWVVPTLEAGWSNVSGFQPVRYQKVGDRIYVEGLIQNTSGATKAASSLIFTLPAGFRPSAAHVWSTFGQPTQVATSGAVSNNLGVNTGSFLGVNIVFSTS